MSQANFSERYKLRFNYDKSNIFITGKRINKNKKWKLCNNFIQETNYYKYLGVHLNRNLSDHGHNEQIIRKGI
jgi:hypothetical protein